MDLVFSALMIATLVSGLLAISTMRASRRYHLARAETCRAEAGLRASLSRLQVVDRDRPEPVSSRLAVYHDSAADSACPPWLRGRE